MGSTFLSHFLREKVGTPTRNAGTGICNFSEGLGTRRRRPLTQTEGRRGVRKGNCGEEGRGEGRERGGGEGREEREERREPFCSRVFQTSSFGNVCKFDVNTCLCVYTNIHLYEPYIGPV